MLRSNLPQARWVRATMPRWRRFGVVASALLLTACATSRERLGTTCHLHASTESGPTPVPAALPVPKQPDTRSLATRKDSDDSAAASALRAQIVRSFQDRAALKRPAPPGETGAVPPGPRPAPAPEPSYDVLILSAGGQFGAYGSGFLKGWGDRSDLPARRSDIDMVTGVSTGAMMASYAYLGSSDDPTLRAKYDALLKNQYTTLRNEDVFRVRSPIEWLWSSSIYDSAPLQARINGLITEELLNDILAEERRSKRLLLVGAVNADSGRFEHFDLIAIAQDSSHDRRACLAAAILASAAIPVAFNPVFINGSMYVDGGARKHAFFLTQVATALPRAPKNVFGILHGDLEVPAQTTKNSLLGVVSRTSAIATDQLVLDSAYHVDSEGKRLGYGVRWTAAVNTGCSVQANDDMFDPALGLCLWDRGLARARDDPDPWKDIAQVTPR